MGTAGRVRGGGGADGNVETPPVRWHPIDTRSHSFKMITLYHRVESSRPPLSDCYCSCRTPASLRPLFLVLCSRPDLPHETKRNGTQQESREMAVGRRDA